MLAMMMCDLCLSSCMLQIGLCCPYCYVSHDCREITLPRLVHSQSITAPSVAHAGIGSGWTSIQLQPRLETFSDLARARTAAAHPGLPAQLYCREMTEGGEAPPSTSLVQQFFSPWEPAPHSSFLQVMRVLPSASTCSSSTQSRMVPAFWALCVRSRRQSPNSPFSSAGRDRPTSDGHCGAQYTTGCLQLRLLQLHHLQALHRGVPSRSLSSSMPWQQHQLLWHQ